MKFKVYIQFFKHTLPKVDHVLLSHKRNFNKFWKGEIIAITKDKDNEKKKKLITLTKNVSTAFPPKKYKITGNC